MSNLLARERLRGGFDHYAPPAHPADSTMVGSGDSGYNSGSEKDRSPLIGDKRQLFQKVADKLGGPTPPPARGPDTPMPAVTLGAVTKKALKKCALIDFKGRLSHIAVRQKAKHFVASWGHSHAE